MSETASPSLRAEPAPMNGVSRISGVFFEPGKTFTDIARRPTWLVPLLISIVFAAVFLNAFNTKVGWAQYLHRVLDNNPRMTQLSAEQRDKAFDAQLKIVPIISYAGVAIFLPLTLILGAAIATGIIKGLLGVPIFFKQAFAVYAWAGLPRVIYSILATVVIFVSPHRENIDPQNAFFSNPAVLMDPLTSSKFLYTIAGAFDIFVIWVLILAAIGLKAAGGKKLSFGGAFFAVVLPYVVWVLVHGALAAAGLSG